MSINCNNMRLCHRYAVQAAQTNPLIYFIMNFSLQVVQHHESADGATRDTCRPVRPAVQERMWLLWQRSVAGAVLQVLEGRVPAGTTKTDPGRLGFGRKVRRAASWSKPSLQITLVVYRSAVFYLDWKFSSVKYVELVLLLQIIIISSWLLVFTLSNVPGTRLQREEEAAYASSHGAQTQSHPQSSAPQPHPGHASMGPFSKFEEKKTNEKTRKVTTVKKFFSPSSRTAPKKGRTLKGKFTKNWKRSLIAPWISHHLQSLSAPFQGPIYKS